MRMAPVQLPTSARVMKVIQRAIMKAALPFAREIVKRTVVFVKRACASVTMVTVTLSIDTHVHPSARDASTGSV